MKTALHFVSQRVSRLLILGAAHRPERRRRPADSAGATGCERRVTPSSKESFMNPKMKPLFLICFLGVWATVSVAQEESETRGQDSPPSSAPETRIAKQSPAALGSNSEDSADDAIARLGALDKRERAAAALAAGKMGPLSEPHRTSLRAALGDPERAVRWNAAWALGQAGADDPQTQGALIRTLADPEPRVAANAAQALGKLGSTAAIDPLTGKLDSESWQVRWVSTLALGSIGTEAASAVPALTARLTTDSNDSVRAAAAKALGQIGTAARPSMKRLLKAAQSPNRLVRASAIGALGSIGADTPEALKLMVDGLTDAEPSVQMNAAHSLGELGPVAGVAVPELVVTLQADVRLVQAISAGALGNIGPEAYKAIPALLLAEQGEHEIVRFKATVALVKIIRGLGQSVPVADDAVPTLIEALASQTPGVVLEAAMTLEAIGPAAIAALPHLETITNSDAHQSVRARTSAAVARIKP